MRRSAAPSSRKFNSPVPDLTKPPSVNENLTLLTKNLPAKTAEPQNSTRSTSAILNILTKRNINNTPKTEILKQVVKESPLKENVPENISPNTSSKTIYNVVWGKKSTKKHKTWEGDGTLEVDTRSATLRDMEGNSMGFVTNIKTELIEEGYILSVGSKEVQIIELSPNGTIISTPVKRSNDEEKESPRPFKKPKQKNTIFNNLNLNTVTKRKQKMSLNYQPLVFPTPSAEHQWTHNKNRKSVVEVSLDTCLAKVLRPHQRTGLIFLYECIMGYKHQNYFGAILADEMGLGKTLQCIALVWTLLKQGPYGGSPIINKVLIVTPSSLTGNWQKEFMSWLGRERIQTFVVDNKNKPNDYKKLNHVPVMIISYEMFARYAKDFEEILFDLLICDEGHRLKNNSIKISTLLNQLECKRRIILTGTPIQNDLQEFYSLSNFVNPGILGSIIEYRKYFEDPIIASREPDIDDEIKKLGQERAVELNKKTSDFILRRTQSLLDKYLPTKTETVIFCKSTELQQKLYTTAVEYWINRDFSSKEIAHLSVITALKKICNHPALIRQTIEEQEANLTNRLTELLPDWDKMSIDDSVKLKILQELLKNLVIAKEKIVVVSSFTQTLDMIADACDCNEYKYCRLDGQTPTNQRTKIVDNFNSSYSESFVFLLSAKAGGVGLNLVGASRLVLFDSDWNPATDLQAMSRVWRDGQKKFVYLYRFLTAGTIEEKIYQRQISKTALSGAVVDPNNSSSIRMSDEELKDLFSVQFDLDCSTHSLLNCDCSCNGIIPEPKEISEENTAGERSCQLGVEVADNRQSLRMNQLMQWEHHKFPFNNEIITELGLFNVASDISFIFRNKCSL